MIGRMAKDRSLRRASTDWIVRSVPYEYSYHFKWLGVPIIQYPADIVAMQEIVWKTRPDLIVETGIARGGSMIFYASLLELLGGKGRVVGVDLDIRPHSRKAITAHPLSRRIRLVEGSSTDGQVVRRVYDIARRDERIMVVLDSNHTHKHVAAELELYSPLVREGSYIVVFDTVIERFPAGYFSDRPWDKGDNPMTAVREFLSTNKRFIVDREMDNKLLLTAAPAGYLLCVRDPPTSKQSKSKRKPPVRQRQT